MFIQFGAKSSSELANWSISDFNIFNSNSNVKPYFNAYSKNTIDDYFDVNKSINIAIELLNYQFDNNNKLIVTFLTDLFNVVSKIITKFNSICIMLYNVLSAGKSFFRCCRFFFLNYGIFDIANKTNNFSWADNWKKIGLRFC